MEDEFGWYFENVVVAGDPAQWGPMRLHRAAWNDVAQHYVTGSPAERRAVRQGFVLTCRQARMAGVDIAQQRSLVRRRRWTRVRYGVLSVLPPGAEDPTAPCGSRPEIAAAAAALVRPRATISHESAGAAHGVPPLAPVPRPVLTATHRTAASNWPDIVVRVAQTTAADLDTWFGAPIMTVARTVVDLGRCSIRAGLVAADAALRDGLLTVQELDAALIRQRGWPGIRRARTIQTLATPFAESPLESLTRLFLYRSGIALPEPQAWVDTPGGRYRVDGLWRSRGVILEVDGMSKYRPGGVTAEKRRQEHLERAGYRVVRVTWEDIHSHPAETVARVLYALRRGGAPQVRA